MPRTYVHVKVIEKEIYELKSQGKSNREIREQFMLTKVQLRNLITRHNQTEKRAQAGILPHRRGRPRKNYEVTEQEKDNEIKRLTKTF